MNSLLSLMRALMSKDGLCPEVKGEGITDGIDITNWSVPHKDQTLTFNVWDFAGQTVYYNTHQVHLWAVGVNPSRAAYWFNALCRCHDV